MMKNKFLAALLVVCLILSVSAIAMAAGEYTDWTSNSTLPTAAGKYKLTKDVTFSGSSNPTVGVYSGNTVEVVLDLNGHTVTFEKGYYYVQNSGSLIIEDSVGTGKITNTASNTDSSSGVIYAKGTCVINGGTIENNYSSGCAVYVNNGDKKQASCTVNSPATIINSNNKSGRAVKVNTNATFTLNGGTVESKASNPNFNAYDIPAIDGSTGSSATININGGTVKAENIAIYSANGPVNVTGGEIDAGSWAFNTRNAVIEPAENSDVKVTAKKAIFKAQASGNHANEVLGGSFDAPQVSKDDKVIVEISGGIYTIDVADEYIAQGYECLDYNNATYKYIVKPVTLIVSFDANGATGTMADDETPYGEDYLLPPNEFVAAEGMEFAGWLVNGETKNTGDTVTLTENTTITAQWSPIPVRVDYDPNNGIDPVPEAAHLSYNEMLRLPAADFFTAPEGKQFKAWQVDGTEYEAGATIFVKKNIVVTAVWDAAPAAPATPTPTPATATPTPAPAAPVVTAAPAAPAPKTGDNTNIALWMSLVLISGVALLGLRKKAKDGK